ncbi:Hypothetical predicted protein, partial [Paramuricea clavata]
LAKTYSSPTLGEIFNPARDCSDIVDQLPEAEDGFYWFVLPKSTKHKIWCDVHTDGGGFALVGMKDSPVSWTVPSNSTPVDPQGPPHWSSDLGDVKVLDFRVQFSTDKGFEGTKADWFYRLNPQRKFGNLFSVNNGCPYLQAGIGNISFVKDLSTQSVLTNNFKCSKFGQHVHHMLGWGKMNYCLRHQCKNGYAVLDAIKFRYDNFGSYSYSAVSSFSGMNHNSTAFVGCDNGKCCACFGPKGGRQNYCGPKCTAINGGTVMKSAFVWFWVRTRMAERLWKRCMEFVVKNSAGKLEKHFIDPQTGTAQKGSCSGKLKSVLNEGTLTVSDKESFEKIPDVPGLLSYRKDDKQLYVNQGSNWQALSTEQELQQLKKQIQSQETKIQKQEKKIHSQEKKSQAQKNKTIIQEKKIENQESKIQSQEKKIQDQENKAIILEKKIQSQENMTQKLEKENQDIVKLIDRLHLPTTCSALLIKHPSTPSGLYHLNPQVYCDMTSKNGVGVTVIGHDSESRTFVKGYESPGSYKRKIKYHVSMEQILAIMKQSKNCEQFIKYECYGSVFRFSSVGSYLGWWVSRQGSQMKYWGGAAVNSGKCACGMTNSCAGGGKCNCDKNDKAWREDSGYLTDKNTLPVTELRFGDTGAPSYEKGYYTLGKLRCWG